MVGYPLGGDTISVTKGVVSRIEVCLCSPLIVLVYSLADNDGPVDVFTYLKNLDSTL